MAIVAVYEISGHSIANPNFAQFFRSNARANSRSPGHYLSFNTFICDHFGNILQFCIALQILFDKSSKAYKVVNVAGSN